MLFLLLSGCIPVEKTPAEQAHRQDSDSAGATDSPYGAGCEAVGVPLVLQNSADILATHHTFLALGTPFAALPILLNQWSDPTCPRESTTDNGLVILEGDCSSTEGATFSGRAEWGQPSAGDYRHSWKFSGFSLRWVGEDGRWWSFIAEGTVVQGSTESNYWSYEDHIVYTVDHDGSWPEDIGTWTRESFLRGDLTYAKGDGWVASEAGTWCETWEEDAVDTCREAGDGHFTIDVGILAEGQYAGSDGCDGCIQVFLDGTDLGQTCP